MSSRQGAFGAWLLTLALATLALPSAEAAGGARPPSYAPWRCKAEADCLKRLGGKASRAGGELRIKGTSGREAVFRDSAEDCQPNEETGAECASYRLSQYDPAKDVWIVDVAGSEAGGSKVFLGKTGETKDLASSTLSPTGRWLLSLFSANEVLGYRLDIASVTGTGLKNVFHYDSADGNRPGPQERHAELVGWKGDDRILLDVRLQLERGEEMRKQASIVHTPKGWVLRRSWSTKAR